MTILISIALLVIAATAATILVLRALRKRRERPMPEAPQVLVMKGDGVTPWAQTDELPPGTPRMVVQNRHARRGIVANHRKLERAKTRAQKDAS